MKLVWSLHLLILSLKEIGAFLLASSIRDVTLRQARCSRIRRCADSASGEASIRGDPIRAATGIRPSLHPLTINTLATVLKRRAENRQELPLQTSDRVAPLQVALSAGKVAADAIAQRQATSTADGMKLLPEEEQTIAGRIVGVTMRLDDLEARLHAKCERAGWVAKYNEWDSFGVLDDETDLQRLKGKLLQDPLFCMNRAECLLALFLNAVEAPELDNRNKTVPGGSIVDFLDADRADVLLQS